MTNRRHFLKSSLAASASCLSMGANAGWAAKDEAKHVDWLAEVQRPPKRLPENSPSLPPLIEDGATRESWRRRREEIRRRWMEFLHPWGERGAVRKYEVVEEDRPPGVLRQRIRYEVEPGLSTEAYLLRPTGRVAGPLPGVIALHSTVNHSIRQPAGVEGKREKFFGLTFAQRGFVTICPRNYLWPTNDKIVAQREADRFHERHPKSKGMAKMLYDAQVAVDILAAQPLVDPKRLGAVGHSLGAKEVLYLAAFDERIRATVSSEGGVGIKFSNWHADWYLGPETEAEKYPGKHHEVLALAAPRAFLLLGGESADGDRGWPYIERALPVYRLYGGKPRLGFFNHHKGHAVPPEAERKIYQWLETYV